MNANSHTKGLHWETHTCDFVVRCSLMASRHQLIKQWIGSVTTVCNPFLFFSHSTCLISCRTLSYPPSTLHFLNCPPNSTQTAGRYEPCHFLCQCWINTTCLPKITLPLSLTPSIPSPGCSHVSCKLRSWRVKLSRLWAILMSVSCFGELHKEYGNHRIWGNGCFVRMRIHGNWQCQTD